MPALHQQDSRLLHVWRFVSADQSRPCQAQIPFALAVGVRARWRKLQVATRIPLMALCCSCCGDVLPMSCQGLDRFADFFRAPLFKKERAVLSSDAGFEAHLCKPNLCWGSAFCCTKVFGSNQMDSNESIRQAFSPNAYQSNMRDWAYILVILGWEARFA